MDASIQFLGSAVLGQSSYGSGGGHFGGSLPTRDDASSQMFYHLVNGTITKQVTESCFIYVLHL